MEATLQGDRELSEALAREEAGALDLAVSRWSPLVYHTCYRVLGDSHAAEDAAQTVFMLLAQRAPQLQSGSPLSSWLYKVATNIALHARRTNARRTRREKEVGKLHGTNDASPSSSNDWEQIKDRLDSALLALPETYREVLVLHYLCGKKFREVAEILDLNESTVSMRVHRGLAKLRSKLALPQGALPQASLVGMLTTQAGLDVPPSLVEKIKIASRSKPALPESLLRCAEQSVRTQALASSSTLILCLGAVVAVAAGTAVYLHGAPETPKPARTEAAAPPPTAEQAPASQTPAAAPSVGAGKYDRRWTFRSGAPTDLLPVMGRWAWDQEKAAMETVDEKEAAIRIPFSRNALPCLVTVTAEVKGKRFVCTVMRLNGHRIFGEEQWRQPEAAVWGRSSLRSTWLVTARDSINEVNGKLVCVFRQNELKEPFDLLLVLQEIRITEIQVKTVTPPEIPQNMRDPDALVKSGNFNVLHVPPQDLVPPETAP